MSACTPTPLIGSFQPFPDAGNSHRLLGLFNGCPKGVIP